MIIELTPQRHILLPPVGMLVYHSQFVEVHYPPTPPTENELAEGEYPPACVVVKLVLPSALVGKLHSLVNARMLAEQEPRREAFPNWKTDTIGPGLLPDGAHAACDMADGDRQLWAEG